MTKLSHTFSYRLLRRWDHFCRLLPPVGRRWEVWSDASGKGYGGHLGPQSAPIDVWQDSHALMSANQKLSTEYVEALAVLLSLRRWSDRLKGKKVFFYVDNYQVYQVLSRRYTPNLNLDLNLGFGLRLDANPRSVAERDRPRPRPPSRERGYFSSNPRCLKTQATFDEIDSIIRANGIQLVARWVWGKDNALADTLSRLGRGSGKLTPHVLGLLEAGKKAGEEVGRGMESLAAEVTGRSNSTADEDVQDGQRLDLALSSSSSIT